MKKKGKGGRGGVGGGGGGGGGRHAGAGDTALHITAQLGQVQSAMVFSFFLGCVSSYIWGMFCFNAVSVVVM